MIETAIVNATAITTGIVTTIGTIATTGVTESGATAGCRVRGFAS